MEAPGGKKVVSSFVQVHSSVAGCLKKKKDYQKKGQEPYRQRGPRVQHRCVEEVETVTEECVTQWGARCG